MSDSKRKTFVPHSTRTNSIHYLIGYSADGISHSNLPTLREVLQYLLYIKETCPKTTKTQDCLHQTVDEVATVWKIARIPTKQKHNIVKLLAQVYDTWAGLKKNVTRSGDPGGRRRAFCDQLDKLWDVGHRDAVSLIQNDPQLSPSQKNEDIAFYEDQRHSRSAQIAGENKIFKKSSSDEFVTLLRSSSTEESVTPPAECDELVELNVPRNLMDDKNISHALDHLKLTNNEETILMSAIIKACGGDVEDFVLSRSSTKTHK